MTMSLNLTNLFSDGGCEDFGLMIGDGEIRGGLGGIKFRGLGAGVMLALT